MAGAIVKAGATAPRRLAEPSSANERGYFESQAFYEFHDTFLNSIGTNWYDWRRIDLHRDLETIEAFRKQAKKILADEFGDAALFVLKDPRICRFAPLWLSVFHDAQIKPHIVIAIRSPFEVAASLHQRNGLPFERCVLMWLRHVLDAERDTRGQSRCFVSMDQLLADWRATMTRIACELQLNWPALDAEGEAEIEAFLNSDLKHHNFESDRKRPSIVWAVNAYEALLRLTYEPQSKSALRRLDAISADFEQACALFNPLLRRDETHASPMRSLMLKIAPRDSLVRYFLVQPLRRMGQQISVLLHRAALGRHVGP